MNEKMMQWSDDTLIAEYWLNIRLNAEAAPDEARYSYETIQEIREVAALKDVDLNAMFRELRHEFVQMTPDELQSQYNKHYLMLDTDQATTAKIHLEALFSAADARQIDLNLVHEYRGDDVWAEDVDEGKPVIECNACGYPVYSSGCPSCNPEYYERA